MAGKRRRLEILAQLPKAELRIARPAFVAEGPKHALKRAVRLLGPFPTPQAADESLELRDVLHFETENDARAYCNDIGETYFANLVEEQTAPRLPEVLRNFEAIAEQCRTLAKTLSYLSYAERYLLHSLWGIRPDALRERLLEDLEEMGVYGPPDPTEQTADGQLAPGALAEALIQLEKYIGRLHYIVMRRYTPKGVTKIDVGGSRTAASIIAPNPRWRLIHDAYQIFSLLPAHEIVLNEGSRFQIFVSSIHEWITDEPGASFMTPIKQYVKVRKRRDDLTEKLASLRTNARTYTPEEFDIAVAEGAKTSTPDHGLRVAMRLSADIEHLNDIMEHGHRIPARAFVTG